jgi:hypothetical protein
MVKTLVLRDLADGKMGSTQREENVLLHCMQETLHREARHWTALTCFFSQKSPGGQHAKQMVQWPENTEAWLWVWFFC